MSFHRRAVPLSFQRAQVGLCKYRVADVIPSCLLDVRCCCRSRRSVLSLSRCYSIVLQRSATPSSLLRRCRVAALMLFHRVVPSLCYSNVHLWDLDGIAEPLSFQRASGWVCCCRVRDVAAPAAPMLFHRAAQCRCYSNVHSWGYAGTASPMLFHRA